MRSIYSLLAMACLNGLASSAKAVEPPLLPAPASCGPTSPQPALVNPANSTAAPSSRRPGLVGRFNNLVTRATSPEHRREPDGCPTPIGCGNFYTEFKFVFGSCRQYFGTGDSSRGNCSTTTVPPPNR